MLNGECAKSVCKGNPRLDAAIVQHKTVTPTTTETQLFPTLTAGFNATIRNAGAVSARIGLAGHSQSGNYTMLDAGRSMKVQNVKNGHEFYCSCASGSTTLQIAIEQP